MLLPPHILVHVLSAVPILWTLLLLTCRAGHPGVLLALLLMLVYATSGRSRSLAVVGSCAIWVAATQTPAIPRTPEMLVMAPPTMYITNRSALPEEFVAMGLGDAVPSPAVYVDEGKSAGVWLATQGALRLASDDGAVLILEEDVEFYRC